MKPIEDYSFIRGVCHGFWPNFSEERLRREMSYCKRLNINSIRFWLSQEEYEKNGEKYLDIIEKFMEICFEFGVNSMPILWNGNFITEFEEPDELFYKKAKIYAEKVIYRFCDKPYLLMWDVINEPMCNDYMNKSPENEKIVRFEKLKKHIRHLLLIVKDIDSENCITIGHEQVWHCESTVDLVDVISYHDYLSTRKAIEGAILEVKALSKKWNKPILNTETGCVGRANPYEIELEMAYKHNVGWYLFNLISDGFWGDIHGIVYDDGSIRNPALIAALFGFFRNTSEKRILTNINKEGHCYRAIKMVEDALRIEPTTLFMAKEKKIEDLYEAIEYCINILEGAELVPMWNPPSAVLLEYRKKDESEINIYELKKFAWEIAGLVKKYSYMV